VGPSDEGETERASVFTNPDELPGQNRKKLDETAGQRLAATGIAAAFAASVAMLGCPVGGALAAAATQVDVVNPATSPALTRSVDDPGRIAYQSTATCVQDSAFLNACDFDFPAVPGNHRLVVQHVSAVLGGNATGAQVNLSGGANQAASSFLAPPSFRGASEFDQPVLQYFDAGSLPFLQAVADTTLTSGSATISGYLLDCATTPCAAIAH